ncbi:hypothetical protein QTP86_002587 [Hemibagrus guttatus]|nr:hypothetical protein QTP86_002587 [Hemibagrus guttatus]
MSLTPLSDNLAAWKLLPGVSQWVLDTVKKWYRIQFATHPSQFQGVLPTIVGTYQTSFLQEEILSLLRKGAIEYVPIPDLDSGFYSRYFIVPKRDRGLHPFLDLQALNSALRKFRLKMLTTKLIASEFRSEDWFVAIDLNNAYFHIGIRPEHRKFLRFAFGLALSPHTFMKCMDAALVPLRLQGICVLNYLDDRLILAHSKAMAASHWDVVLAHMRSLGLRINPEKCVLSPSQRTTLLGVIWNSTTMWACPSPARVASILLALNAVQLDQSLSVTEAQFWLRGPGFHPHRHPVDAIRVRRGGLRTLLMWTRPRFLALGPTLGMCHHHRTLSTNASLSGWGPLKVRSSLVRGPCLPSRWHSMGNSHQGRSPLSPSGLLLSVRCQVAEAFLQITHPLLEPQPMESEKFLIFKTTLLLALASFRRVGDLQALSVAPTCLEFAPDMS